MIDVLEQRLRNTYAFLLGTLFLAAFLSQNVCACPAMAGERPRVAVQQAVHEHSCCQSAPEQTESTLSLYDDGDCCCSAAVHSMEAVLPSVENQIQISPTIAAAAVISSNIATLVQNESRAAAEPRAPPWSYAPLPAYIRFRALLI